MPRTPSQHAEPSTNTLNRSASSFFEQFAELARRDSYFLRLGIRRGGGALGGGEAECSRPRNAAARRARRRQRVAVSAT